MGFFRQGGWGRGCGWLVAAAMVGFGCTDAGSAAVRGAAKVPPWDAAVAARARFEAEPAGTHTRVEYAAVMDAFRAIYHADPGDPHAARAVEQVAELLEEQGTELGDKKSLKDAAGQFGFLAKAYPAYAQPEKRRVAAAKLGELPPGDAAGQAKRISPTGMTSKGAGESVAESPGSSARTPTSQGRDVGHPAAEAGRAQTASEVSMATVTGIRHWSTPTYTRVAIDLAVQDGGDVKYEAARVEHPDRLFFDLHHARLAAGMVGKSYTITDNGFLTKIRAAAAGEDVTRVVLDVHAVGEYSAFLLPNPLRLIIDIHGKQQEAVRQGAASREKAGAPGGQTAAPVEERSGTSNPAIVAEETAPGAASNADASPDAPLDAAVSQRVAPSPATPAAGVAAPVLRAAPAAASSLPPMPVTDGSAAFGLPVKRGVAGSPAAVQPVAQPRVVISSRPTLARPVPNAVARSSASVGGEVGALSAAPGKVEATAKPTSLPVSVVSASPSGEEAKSSGSAVESGAKSDHYVPRSKRAVSAGTAASIPDAAPSENRDAGHTRTNLKPAAGASPVEAAPPTADGETSLVRALGLKIGRIVIDAGHGGHDSGTLGVGGIEEKDVVLDVALRLGKLLHDRLGAEIVYTRADDTFIPLETRTAIANKAQADLFISVHANSSQEPSARGVEVYYLNFTSDPEAMKVASRENAVSTQSVHELSDLVKKIALKDKIEESKELAGDVDASLYAGLAKGNEGLRDRGVKKAPFVVLIGANMPSILAEISFVTNAEDAEQLGRAEYRERVAESLYGGVARYAAGINGQATKKKVKVERAAR